MLKMGESGYHLSCILERNVLCIELNRKENGKTEQAEQRAKKSSRLILSFFYEISWNIKCESNIYVLSVSMSFKNIMLMHWCDVMCQDFCSAPQSIYDWESMSLASPSPSLYLSHYCRGSDRQLLAVFSLLTLISQLAWVWITDSDTELQSSRDPSLSLWRNKI